MSQVKTRGRMPTKASAVPYVAIGLGLYAFLLIALSVPLIEPIFLWAMAHGLVFEKALELGLVPKPSNEGMSGWWISRLYILAWYLVASLVAWLLVERPGLDRARVWKRAILSWLAIQAVFCLAVFVLGTVGVLHE